VKDNQFAYIIKLVVYTSLMLHINELYEIMGEKDKRVLGIRIYKIDHAGI